MFEECKYEYARNARLGVSMQILHEEARLKTGPYVGRALGRA